MIHVRRADGTVVLRRIRRKVSREVLLGVDGHGGVIPVPERTLANGRFASVMAHRHRRPAAMVGTHLWHIDLQLPEKGLSSSPASADDGGTGEDEQENKSSHGDANFPTQTQRPMIKPGWVYLRRLCGSSDVDDVA